MHPKLNQMDQDKVAQIYSDLRKESMVSPLSDCLFDWLSVCLTVSAWTRPYIKVHQSLLLVLTSEAGVLTATLWNQPYIGHVIFTSTSLDC